MYETTVSGGGMRNIREGQCGVLPLRSAYQMLHNPNVKVGQLVGVVPQLDSLDPQILERAGIEGRPLRACRLLT